MANGSNSSHGPVTSAEVRRIAGPLDDDAVAELLRIGASLDELEIAASYARGEGDLADRVGHPLSGKVAQLYEILREDDPEEELAPR